MAATISGKSTPQQQTSSKFSGVVLTVAIATLAYRLGVKLPLVGGPVFGILLGLIVAMVWKLPAGLKPGMKFSSKQLLQAAIVLMGFGLSFDQVVRTGAESLAVMLTTLAICLVSSVIVGRLLGVSSNLIALIGAGTGICGGSAIAAVAPAIEADEQEVAYALSTVFAFNIVAVLIFPALGHLLGFSQKAFGLWAGTAINDTSSVVAAAYAYGQEAGTYATVVKLARATMIVPIVAGLAAWRTRRTRAEGLSLSKVVPWFILWFMVAALIRSAGVLPAFATTWLPWAGRFLMVAALTAVGLTADLKGLVRTGWRPLAMGAILWGLVAVSSIVMQRVLGQV